MTLIEKYICETCQCQIGNSSGRNNITLNVVDVVMCLIYIAIAMGVLWTDGIANLPFIATSILIIRSILGQFRKFQKVRKDGNCIVPAYQNRMLIYVVFVVLASIIYISMDHENIKKILLTIFYVISLLFDLTNILLDCYEATPRVYQEVKDKVKC